MDKGKRPVGRPRKYPLAVQGDTSDQKPERPVGFPRNDGSGPSNASSCLPKLKRKVGRPRKSAPRPGAEFIKPINPDDLDVLHIPPFFTKLFGDLFDVNSCLVGPDQRYWDIAVKKRLGDKEGVYIARGWKAFREAYEIGPGNICHFKHCGWNDFKVQVFHGNTGCVAFDARGSDEVEVFIVIE